VNITTGATLTGGATTVLSPAGITPGKSTFVGPDHTRLVPNTVDFTVSGGNPIGSNPGVARTGVKISFANRLTEEGCCTVKAGSVIVDLGVRWSLDQPSSLVDDALDFLKGLVFSTAFEDAVKKGVLPAS